MKRILVVAGEASADIYGARLIDELKRSGMKAYFAGVGGDRMHGAGVDIRIHARSFSLVGISEWFDRWRSVLLAYRHLKRVVECERWDGAVLIDLPDVNLRLAGKLKRRSVPICYYVSPQLWAWRSGRIQQIRRYVDKMLVLYPFEEQYYRQRGVNVSFVGHPLTEIVCERVPVDFGVKPLRIALLPGSRVSEVRYHAAILSSLMAKLRQHYGDVQFVVPVPGTLSENFVRSQLSSYGAPSVETCADSHEALRACHIAIVASGTATLEATLTGIPFCLFYRVGRSSKWLFDRLVNVPFIGMPNLLMGREVVREFFQEQATSEALLAESIRLIDEEPYRDTVLGALNDCRRVLGAGGVPSARAAQYVELLVNDGEKAIQSLHTP